MSERTEEEKQAIIRNGLDSTESDISSTKPEPNTDVSSPFYPNSIPSTSSSTQSSEEIREYAKKGEDIPCTVSSGSSHTSTSKSPMVLKPCPSVSKTDEEKESQSSDARMSRNEEAQELFCSGEKNLNEGETVLPAPVEETAIEKIHHIVEKIVKHLFKLCILKVEGRREAGAKFAQFCAAEYRDLFDSSSILGCTAHLEPYIRSLDRRSSHNAKTQKILNEILTIAMKFYKNFDTHRFIVNEAFQRAIKSEKRLVEMISFTDEPRDSAFDIFQESLGTGYIPEITGQDLEKFNSVLKISSESNSEASTSRQRTAAEEDQLAGITRTCSEPAESVLGKSHESCSEKPQRPPTKRAYNPILDSNEDQEEFSPKKRRPGDSSIESSSSEVSRKDGMGEASTSTSGLESNISSPRGLLVIKQKALSPVCEVNSGQAATKRGCDPNSDSNEDQELFSPKKRRPGDSSIESSSSEVSRKDTMGETSTSTSGLESNISSPHRLPVGKQKVLSPVSSVDGGQSATKRGCDPNSDSNEDQELFSPKKLRHGDSSIESSSSEALRKDTVEEPSTSTSGFYSNASQRPESMADISESATESRELASGTIESLESSDSTRDRAQPVVRSSRESSEDI